MIRIHQQRTYPGRYVGTGLTNPDFAAIARAFGMRSEHVTTAAQIDASIERGLAAPEAYFIEVATSLPAALPGNAGDDAKKGIWGD